MMMSNLTKDDIASLISEDDAVLMKRRLILKKEIKLLDKKLKELDKDVKGSMADADFKTIESHGIRFTYTKPRMYEDFVSKQMAISYLKDIGRADLIQKKSGYSRLTITKVK